MSAFALAITLAILGSVFGDFFVKKASPPPGRGPAGASIVAVLGNRWMLIGLLLMTIHFAGFLVALKLGPVTVVIPLLSCTYVLTTVMGRIALRERVVPLRWTGVVVIMLGVVVLGLSTLR